MSNLQQYRQQVVQYGQNAVQCEEQDQWEQAYNNYYQALKIFSHMIKYEKNEHLKKLYIEKMGQYMDRAEYIKAQVMKKPQPQNAQEKNDVDQGGEMIGQRKAQEKKPNDSNNEHQDQLKSAILSEKPNVRWSDISGLENAKDGLKEAVLLPVKFPKLFQGQRKPWSGILLYGPPGTGKSLLAKAAATECQSTFFSISSSDLISKWQGESERLVKNLFVMAREMKPSIIFIDEIDSLCGKRREGESESVRRVKTEFLVQMDGCGNNQDGVLVLGATNTPWELDEAFRRRFQKKIYIDLPDMQARANIFRLNVAGVQNTMTEEDFYELAEASQNYSGADIHTVSKEALFLPIRKCLNAVKFKQMEDGYYVPCSPSDAEGEEMDMYSIPDGKVREPPVCLDDYMKALTKIKPSVCLDDLERYVDFTGKFGQDS